MENKLVEEIINRCRDNGYSYIKIICSKVFSLKVGFECNDKLKKSIDITYINIYAIKDKKLSRLLITYNKKISMDLIIDMLVKNSVETELLCDYIRLISYNDLTYTYNDSFSNMKKRINNNQFINNTYKWICDESKNISDKFKCSVISNTYDYEVTETYMIDSHRNKGNYINESSKVNGMCNLVDVEQCEPIHFCIENILTNKNLCNRLNQDRFRERLWCYNSYNNIMGLKGKIKLSYRVVSNILIFLAQIFNVEAINSNMTFLKSNQIGEKIFNDNINLLDIPNCSNCCLRYPFDMEGVPTKKKHLIKNGVLQDTLSNIENSIKCKKAKPGNSYRRLPFYSNINIFPTNLYLDLGEEIEEYYDTHIIELQAQTRLDFQTGLLIGKAFGYIIKGNNRIPGVFQLNLSIFSIFKYAKAASQTKKWMQKTCIPEVNIYIE